jgi:hypothetical protein
MPDIVEIRILPPLAIGRLGSSATPLENYTLEIANPVGYRTLVPASTLVVDPVTGAVVSEHAAASVSFRDAQGNIKPVSPFLEVWMLLAGAATLTPLTLQALRDAGADETAVSWSVEVGNIKAFRRTGDPNDKITASAAAFSNHNLTVLPLPQLQAWKVAASRIGAVPQADGRVSSDPPASDAGGRSRLRPNCRRSQHCRRCV